MDRNVPLSIVKATGSEIAAHINLFDLLERITSNEKMLQDGRELKAAAKENRARYEILKRQSYGFVIGNFSYRNAQSCVQYHPLLGFDIDHIGNEEEMRKAWRMLKAWENTFLLLPSISWEGLRVMVWCDCTQETHRDFYQAIAHRLSEMTGIKLKSQIKANLKSLGWSGEKIAEYLKENPNIDDSTSDISRFWYYTGIDKQAIYRNDQSKVFSLDTVRREVRKTAYQEPVEGNDQEKIEALLELIEAGGIDITAGVAEWFKVGLGIAYTFGEEGRGYYHRFCQFHPDYKQDIADKDFDRCLLKCHNRQEVVTLGSLYYLAEQYGVKVESKPKAPREAKRAALPPLFNDTAERAVIAFCLTHGEEIDLIFDYYPAFKAECFYGAKEADLFRSILLMRSRQMGIDRVSVASFASLPMSALAEYDAAASDHIHTLCTIVYSDYIRRELVRQYSANIDEVKKPKTNVFELLDRFQTQLAEVTAAEKSTTEVTFQDSIAQAVEQIQHIQDRLKSGESLVTGVPTGLVSEDLFFGGYQDTDLIVIAARPGMGKTAKVLKTALEASKAGFPVGFFSLEMGHLDLTRRILSIESGIPGQKMGHKEMTPKEIDAFNRAIEKVYSLPILIDDKAAATIDYIERVAAKWKRQHGIRILIVDYLQLIGYSGEHKGNAVKQVTEISDRLKGIAKRLNIPVIALSQLSRSVEIRGGTKRPQLSDLRESGGIEQAADIVQFIYRPEYYGITEDEEGNSVKGLVYLINAKNRKGPRGDLNCLFIPETTEFKDMEGYSANYLTEEMPF